MISAKRGTFMLVLIALQAVFLLSLAGSYYAVDMVGKEIKLKTAPIDPRDLFYGDYVTLNYEISRIPLTEWKGADSAENGDRIYVVLKQEGEVYRAVAAYPDRPKLAADEVMLRGRVEYADQATMWVHYGLERYYVAEGTGKELEEKREGMLVRVKIAPWGQAKISGLEY